MSRRYFGIIFLLCSALIMFLACSPASRKGGVSPEITIAQDLPEGKGDAYLYDLKIYREGKKNSVRLDVYRNRDSLSFFARG